MQEAEERTARHKGVLIEKKRRREPQREEWKGKS